MTNNFLSANTSALELMQSGANVVGLDLNRITTALNGLRSGLVTLVGPTIQTNFDPLNLGGVLINNSGIKVIADGTAGIPIGTVVWNSQNTGQFTTAQFFPVYGGYQQVDGTYRARIRFFIPATVTKFVKSMLSFTLQPFHVGNQTTAAANTSAGGSAHSHTVTIGNHTHTTPAHKHELFDTVSTGNAMPATYELFTANNSSGSLINVGMVGDSPGGVNVWTPNSTGSGTSANGGATTPTSSNESTHTHVIPSLSLNAPSAIYEAGMAQGVHVFVDNGSGLVDQTTPLAGPWGAGVALDVSNLDITSYITTSGWKEIQLSSTAIGGITAQVIFQWIGQAI
jgi:hypothetical protein